MISKLGAVKQHTRSKPSRTAEGCRRRTRRLSTSDFGGTPWTSRQEHRGDRRGAESLWKNVARADHCSRQRQQGRGARRSGKGLEEAFPAMVQVHCRGTGVGPENGRARRLGGHPAAVASVDQCGISSRGSPGLAKARSMSDQAVAKLLRSPEPLVIIEAAAGCGKTYQGAAYEVKWIRPTSVF